ncbi:hypothetical protein AeRB84_015386 [Aphanomyces euteiches]|nr:hypothetical protein AeRB84_015386 [Aphanomyces euteiches]
MLKLFCVVVGEGRPFSVKIDASETVDDLKKKIKEEKENTIRCDPDALQLYCVDGLAQDENEQFLHNEITIDMPNCPLDDFGSKKKLSTTFPLSSYPQLNDTSVGRIHVLVLPEDTTSAPRQLLAESARVEDKLWLVCGSITNASSIKGVRCRLYRLAGTFLGYYDPARTVKDSALWYEDKTLRIHILFKTEENALRFDNALQEEPVTLGSPLNGQQVSTNVTQVNLIAVPSQLRRIYFMHYVPQESESPQDTISSISLTSSVTVVDPSTEEFCYQRIEDDRYFLPRAEITNENSPNTIVTQTIGLHFLARCMDITTV